MLLRQLGRCPARSPRKTSPNSLRRCGASIRISDAARLPDGPSTCERLSAGHQRPVGVGRDRPEPRVVHWLKAQPVATLFLSAVTIGEIRKGLVVLPQGRRRTAPNWRRGFAPTCSTGFVTVFRRSRTQSPITGACWKRLLSI